VSEQCSVGNATWDFLCGGSAGAADLQYLPSRTNCIPGYERAAEYAPAALQARSADRRPDVEGTIARNTELMQALEKLFEAEPECGSPMQFLEHFHSYYEPIK
jgi:hypothetical protein